MPWARVLVAAVDAGPAQALASTWAGPEGERPAACACSNLVREVVRLAPEVVVLRADGLDAPLAASLQALADSQPRPLLWLGDAPLPADAQQLLALGVWGWLPAGATAAQVQPLLALVRAHWQQARAGEQALADALARLDERKWVDRAKGVLMRHQQLSEADAFTLLRTASQHSNLRVGEISRGLIEGAAAAAAVNQAGQLRMLSQRVVKALALLALGVETAQAARWRHDSLQRLQTNLDALALLALAEPAAGHLDQAGRAGAALLAAAAAPVSGPEAPTPDSLARADQCAEALLVAADALTDAVEAASGRRSLQVVNLCGRQRMLSQRLAKQALLSALLPGPAADAQAAAAAQTLADFETALRALEQAPLASNEIRAALAQARGEWLRLLQAVRQTAGGAVPAALARESEALLASFEQLTSLVEHSMQVLLG